MARGALLRSYGAAFLDQLYDFIAVDAMNNLRNVLLLDKAMPLPKRVALAKEFVSREMVAAALREAETKCSSSKERLKIRLALCQRIWLLYGLFAGKQMKLYITAGGSGG